MILEVVKDTVPFATVFFAIMIWFSLLFIKLDDMNEEFTDGTVKDSFDKMFKLMLVNLDYEVGTNLGWVVTFGAECLLVIIMLNLLISVVGDTYDKVQLL